MQRRADPVPPPPSAQDMEFLGSIDASGMSPDMQDLIRSDPRRAVQWLRRGRPDDPVSLARDNSLVHRERRRPDYISAQEMAEQRRIEALLQRLRSQRDDERY